MLKKVQPLFEGAVQIKRKSEIAQFSNLSDAPCGICTSILKLGSGKNKILSNST